MEYSHHWLPSNILLLLKMCYLGKMCFGDHIWVPKRVISLDRWLLNRLNVIKTNLRGFKMWSPFTGGLLIAITGFTVYDFYYINI